MKKIVFWTLLVITSAFRSAYSQSSLVRLPDSSLVISLEKTFGFGPQGHVSHTIGSSALQDAEEKNLYPALVSIPKLDSVKSFFYVYNWAQFYYQNYRSGALSKKRFLEFYKTHQLELKDTLSLSTNAINTLISVIIAQDSTGKDVFMVDANHNSDLSDDVIRPLPEDSYNTNMQELTSRISIASFFDHQVKEESVLVVIMKPSGHTEGQSLLTFSFPEFRYSRFSYGGKKYLLCTDVIGLPRKPMFLLPDLPSFSAAPREARIDPNQFLTLGDDHFMYLRAEGNGIRLILQKSKSNHTNLANVQPSAQAGHPAPEIKGTNLEDGKAISLSALKGKYVFIDFWSTTCGPCIADFPALVKLYNSYDKKKIEFVGMADERDKGKVKELLDSYQIKWPTLISNTETTFFKGYNVSSYPTSFLIAPDGKIAKLDLRSKELKNVLDELLK